MEPQAESGNAMWYAIGVIAIIAIVSWYFYAGRAPKPVPTTGTAVEQADNTTAAAIMADFNAMGDAGTALTQDEASASEAVKAF